LAVGNAFDAGARAGQRDNPAASRLKLAIADVVDNVGDQDGRGGQIIGNHPASQGQFTLPSMPSSSGLIHSVDSQTTR